jgi:hypothetical protein
VKNVLVSAIALTALAGSAMAQSPYGSVEFRWRERAIGVTNTVNLPVGATAFSGAALNQTTNPTANNDARFVLVLEARVTRAAGNSDLGGLAGIAFNLVSSDSRAQGTFAASSVSGSPDLRNAASASTAVATGAQPNGSGVVLPAGATGLPGTDNNGDRGVFGPFRRVADLGGKNQPAIGVQNNSSSGPLATKATLENVTVAASVDPLSFVDPDTGDNGPYFGRNDFYGLNNWVPIFTAVYNLADLTGRSQISIAAEIAGAGAGDTGVRGFRGVNNPVGNIDSWTIDTAGIPTFTIVIPAPGAAALAGLGGLMITRRRRA